MSWWKKPITETIGQAQQLGQIAEERGLVLQVGHIERFNPAFLELKNVTSHFPQPTLMGQNLLAQLGLHHLLQVGATFALKDEVSYSTSLTPNL
jgi:hypothetical protein